jgi:hypothetical protein
MRNGETEITNTITMSANTGTILMTFILLLTFLRDFTLSFSFTSISAVLTGISFIAFL